MTSILISDWSTQAWKLRRQYVREWENWMEMLVLAAAIVTMACKQVRLPSDWSILLSDWSILPSDWSILTSD